MFDYENRKKPFVSYREPRSNLHDYSAWDYYQKDYDNKTSKVNLYYRGLIEDMQSKFLTQLDTETIRANVAQESSEKTQLEMRAVINVKNLEE